MGAKWARYVRKLLDYNPETGMLSWRVSRGRARAGDEAGCIHHEGYRKIMIGGRAYLAHRLAFLVMTGRWPHDQLDHINGARSDNRWKNLRETDAQGNSRNQRVFRNNTSGHMGVNWSKRARKWKSYINLDGRQKHLGCFDDLAEAVTARKAAEHKYGFHPNHGECEL